MAAAPGAKQQAFGGVNTWLADLQAVIQGAKHKAPGPHSRMRTLLHPPEPAMAAGARALNVKAAVINDTEAAARWAPPVSPVRPAPFIAVPAPLAPRIAQFFGVHQHHQQQQFTPMHMPPPQFDQTPHFMGMTMPPPQVMAWQQEQWKQQQQRETWLQWEWEQQQQQKQWEQQWHDWQQLLLQQEQQRQQQPRWCWPSPFHHAQEQQQQQQPNCYCCQHGPSPPQQQQPHHFNGHWAPPAAPPAAPPVASPHHAPPPPPPPPQQQQQQQQPHHQQDPQIQWLPTARNVQAGRSVRQPPAAAVRGKVKVVLSPISEEEQVEFEPVRMAPEADPVLAFLGMVQFLLDLMDDENRRRPPGRTKVIIFPDGAHGLSLYDHMVWANCWREE